MKSGFFRKFGFEIAKNSAFVNDFKILLCFDVHKIEVFLREILKVVMEDGPINREELTDKLGGDLIDMDSVIDVSFFVIKRLVDEAFKDDSPAILAADFLKTMADQEIEVDFDKDRVQEVFGLFMKLSPEYERVQKRKMYQAGILPVLKSAETTVEVRALQTEKYRATLATKDYEPKIEGHVSIISIRLTFDDEDVNDCFFQGSPQDLREFVSSLEAALKDSEAFESYLGGD